MAWQVIDYCKYHKDSPPEEIQKPLKSTNLVECGVSEWDNEYVNIEQEALSAESSKTCTENRVFCVLRSVNVS